MPKTVSVIACAWLPWRETYALLSLPFSFGSLQHAGTCSLLAAVIICRISMNFWARTFVSQRPGSAVCQFKDDGPPSTLFPHTTSTKASPPPPTPHTPPSLPLRGFLPACHCESPLPVSNCHPADRRCRTDKKEQQLEFTAHSSDTFPRLLCVCGG